MMHEKQVRQLCAIHAVNNLLQLPPDLDLDSNHDGECHHVQTSDHGSCELGKQEEEYSDEVHQKAAQIVLDWTCHGKMLYSTFSGYRNETPNANRGDPEKRLKRPWHVATQDEFNDIAIEFTLREQMLMNGDESTFLSSTSSVEDVKSSGMSQDRFSRKISLFQRFRSQYGTPYLGNYSLEVMKEALNRRGVELEFYRVPNTTEHTPPPNENNNKKTTESAGTDDASSSLLKCLIGFIIYEKGESRRSALSFLSRIGSHIPIIKHLFGVGQHWYAITGVKHRRQKSPSVPVRKDFNDDESWYLIDSKATEMSLFQNGGELMDHMREVQRGGGLVFRALMELRQTEINSK